MGHLPQRSSTTSGSTEPTLVSVWPDRVAGLALMLLAVATLFAAHNFYVPYQYEPLGPRFFPYLVGGLLLLAGLVLLLRPGALAVRLARSEFLLFSVMLFYALAFEVFGFLLSTILVLAMSVRLTGQTWRQAVVGAIGIGFGSYLLLVFLLGLQLPQGTLWQL